MPAGSPSQGLKSDPSITQSSESERLGGCGLETRRTGQSGLGCCSANTSTASNETIEECTGRELTNRRVIRLHSHRLQSSSRGGGWQDLRVCRPIYCCFPQVVTRHEVLYAHLVQGRSIKVWMWSYESCPNSSEYHFSEARHLSKLMYKYCLRAGSRAGTHRVPLGRSVRTSATECVCRRLLPLCAQSH